MTRTFRALSWQDEQAARESSKRASTLVRVGAILPASFCLGKQPYPSRNEARRAANTIYQQRGKVQHPYPCPRCAHFHLGTTLTED